MKIKPHNAKIAVIVLILLTACAYFFVLYPFSDMITYALGTLICMILMKYLGTAAAPKRKIGLLGALFVSLPAILLAVNNFPLVAIFAEKPSFDIKISDLLITLALCLLVAIFEETMFRAFVSKEILKNADGRTQYIRKVMLAGAIFGLYHLLNIFFGASVGYTLLQVTYTTLIGAMLTVVYDKTKRLWICVLIHFIYNVGGDSVSLLGINDQWVLPEILLTVLVSLAVLVFYVVYVLNTENKKTNC